MEEQWKQIKDFPDYAVSNCGRVKRLTKNDNTYPGKILKPWLNSKGYCVIKLSKNNTITRKMIHKLVVQAFNPCIKDGLCVNHKNGVKTDNRAENLEMITFKENMRHGFNTGLIPTGEKHYKAKLKNYQVKLIKKILHYKKINMPKITYKKIAFLFNVKESSIADIACGRRWKRIIWKDGVV